MNTISSIDLRDTIIDRYKARECETNFLEGLGAVFHDKVITDVARIFPGMGGLAFLWEA